MSESMTDRVRTIFDLAAPNRRLHCFGHLASICIRQQDTWVNVVGSLILSPVAGLPGHQCIEPINLHPLRARCGVAPPDLVDDLLRDIAAGQLSLRNLPDTWTEPVRLSGEMLSPVMEFTSSRTEAEFGIKLLSIVLTINGPGVNEVIAQNLLKDIEGRLRGHQLPFADLGSLVRYLRISDGLQSYQVSGFSVVSPYWARLEEAHVDQDAGLVDVGVRTWWPKDTASLSLGVIPLTRETGQTRIRHAYRNGEWARQDDDDGSSLLTARLPIRPTSGPLRVSLNYHDRSIDSLLTGLPSPRVLAHQMFDPDFSSLQDRLFPVGKRYAQRFEEGVAWLLHLCGFSTVNYGFKDVDRGTDVVGFLGTGRAVYAECTLETPGEAKIASLSGRATDFSRNYERSCSASIDVLACVFVQRDRARIARGVSDMIERHRVALLCNEQAHQLLEMAQRGEEASDVFNFLKAEASRLLP